MENQEDQSSDAHAIPNDAFLRVNQPPFSFRYDGVASSVLLPTWSRQQEATTGNDQMVRTVRWTDPKTRLEVKATVTSYHDFPAVE